MSICDAYSGGCPPEPSYPPPTFGPPMDYDLPVTGFTGGDLVTAIVGGIGLVLLGLALLYVTRGFAARSLDDGQEPLSWLDLRDGRREPEREEPSW